MHDLRAARRGSCLSSARAVTREPVGLMQLFGGLMRRGCLGELERLGSDLDARVKVNLPPRLAWDDRAPRRARRLKAVGPHAAKVQFYCALDAPQGSVDGLARGHTARQVWN